jgi:hypothetical protein
VSFVAALSVACRQSPYGALSPLRHWRDQGHLACGDRAAAPAAQPDPPETVEPPRHQAQDAEVACEACPPPDLAAAHWAALNSHPEVLTERYRAWSRRVAAMIRHPASILLQALNTNARPARVPSPYAPTTAAVPETATEMPKLSFATTSEPFSSSVCFQPDAVLVNRYARPARLA